MQPTLFDELRRSDVLAAHLERLRAGGPARWRPSRLILQNFWLFDDETFPFVHGRLVLRGANATGKSTVLVSAVTLALDGEKRRERMDPFGGQGRSAAYYLVGDPKATPNSEFYHDERTGYVALEFEHGATGAYVTIGLGLYTSRARPSLEVDSWGFVIRDGRRVGIDLHLHTGGAEPVPLTARQLREVLGPGGAVVERASDYQELVNRTLFGFDRLEQFRFLINLLLQLRSPKLNKDLKPSDVCGLLSASLPPLDEDLLDQVTQIIEDIDACLESLATTAAHLEATRALDQALAQYLNQLAQEAALGYRTTHGQLAEARERHRREAADLARRREELAALERRLEEAEREERSVVGRLQALEEHEAVRHQDRLDAAERERDEAAAALRRDREAVTAARRVLAELDGRRERLAGEWEQERAELGRGAAHLAELADHARWPLARDRAAAAAQSLERLFLDQLESEEDPTDALQPGSLRQAGNEREAALRQVLERLKKVEQAERRHQEAMAKVEQARRAVWEADAQRQDAVADLEKARDAAVSALYAWREECAEPAADEAAVQAVAAGVQAYADGAADPRALLAPLEQAAAARRAALLNQADALRSERADLVHRHHALRAELDGWLGRKEAEPPRRPGQADARRLLAERGIPAVPLYAACDALPGLAPERLSALEEDLEESGLLDALVVPADRAGQVAAILTAAGLGDRWLAPAGLGNAGSAPPGCAPLTLADFLKPVPCAVPEADVIAALRAVAVDEAPRAAQAVPGASGVQAALYPQGGGWRVGLVAGTATRRPAPAVLYIGEANRRRERDAQVARLRAALAEVEAQIAALDDRLMALEQRRAALEADLSRARALPVLAALQGAAVAVAHAEGWLTRCEQQLAAADKEALATQQRLVDARSAAEEVLSRVPEARGLTAEGAADLLHATRRTVEAAGTLAAQLRRLTDLRRQHRQVLQDIAAEEERLRAHEEAAAASDRRLAAWQARCDAIRERLASLGVDLRQLLAEMAALRRRRDALQKQQRELSERRGALSEAVRRLEEGERELAAAVERLTRQAAEAAAGLERRLRAYPTLQKALDLFRSGPDGPLAAAEELLRLRRAAPEDLPRQVEESRKEAYRQLSDLFYKHRSLLVEFRPALEDDLLTFRDQGARLLPYQLLERLESHRALQEQVLREKESQLYEEFILKEVASAIRERIVQAEAWRDEINRLLAERRLSNGEILSVAWRPLAPDRLTGTQPARIVELLRRDVETLTDAEVEELTAYFRARVGEVREQERQNALEKSFGEALRDALDYRRWFAFSLHSKMPGHDRVELTDHRFATRSGAEKSLAMFIPLLAAAHACYAAAAPDAPKLVGLDEAFAGVDEQNTREMFRFMVELDFSWIMTSEKLWGVADTLPGCVTCELVRRGSVVTPILYVWDGAARHGGLDAAPGGAAGTRPVGDALSTAVTDAFEEAAPTREP